MRASIFIVLLYACGGGSADTVVAAAPGQQVLCPPQTAATFVIIAAGQSNAGNSQEKKFASEYGARIVNFKQGKCYVAQSPLYFSTNDKGESWTLLGNKLIEAGADQVVIVMYAVGSTTMDKWQAGGPNNKELLVRADELQTRYKITHVLWHQGESDYTAGTDPTDYKRMFYSLVDSLRLHDVTAPFYASVATMCPIDSPSWTDGNPLQLAQIALPDVSRNVLAGPNTDLLVPASERFDGCHFSAVGQEKFASAWAEILRSR